MKNLILTLVVVLAVLSIGCKKDPVQVIPMKPDISKSDSVFADKMVKPIL